MRTKAGLLRGGLEGGEAELFLYQSPGHGDRTESADRVQTKPSDFKVTVPIPSSSVMEPNQEP